MAIKDDSNETLDKTVAGKTGLSDMSEDALSHLGGELDDIDTETFDEADFGNDFDPDKAAPSVEDESIEEDPEPEESEEEPEPEPEESEEEPEPEESEEEPEDDEDADEDEDDKGKPGKKQTVPIDRFRTVNKRMRELERELEERDRREAAARGKDPENEAKPYDFDAAEEEAADFLLDGNKEAYKAKRAEIRAAMKAELETDTRSTARETYDATRDQEVMDELADVYSAKYPAMDIDHPDFNPEVNAEVKALMFGYMDNGLTPARAFNRALDRAVKIYDLEAADAAEGEEAPAAKKPGGPKKVTKKKSVKGKVEKRKQAPPDTTGAGQNGGDGGDGTDLRIEELSDEELEAMPESRLKRLRGDLI